MAPSWRLEKIKTDTKVLETASFSSKTLPNVLQYGKFGGGIRELLHDADCEFAKVERESDHVRQNAKKDVST